ncbi:MAG: hypothetical protein V3S97_11410 [Candidatus Bathyarchaeia archaeon]
MSEKKSEWTRIQIHYDKRHSDSILRRDLGHDESITEVLEALIRYIQRSSVRRLRWAYMLVVMLPLCAIGVTVFVFKTTEWITSIQGSAVQSIAVLGVLGWALLLFLCVIGSLIYVTRKV